MNRRAFTLAELVVVIGLVALLTVGIGRLFAGVSDAVTRGLAASELDATARAIEDALRADFDLVNEMQSEDLFLAIRAVELGHPDRPVYLSAEDAEADLRDGLAPYDPGSRALRTRLDEMAFLARAPGASAFRSQQDNGLFTAAQPTAEGARIYYGHGLRPRFDPNWPPDPTDPDPPTTPLRQFVSDGYFASPPGADQRAYLPDGVVSGRNQYAGDWILARQALVLYGARATGADRPDSADPPVGTDREYAPYVRDLENLSRFWENLLSDAPNGVDLLAWPGPVNTKAGESGSSVVARPDPRLISHGRVDLAAQTIEDVRRWLEGERPDWSPMDGYSATPLGEVLGSAFGVSTAPNVALRDMPRYGLNVTDLRGTTQGSVQRFLWKRSADVETSTQFDATTSNIFDAAGSGGGPLPDLAYNLIGVRSAIAGVFSRPLVEFEPSPLSRAEDIALTTPEDRDRYAAQTDGEMDTHAVLATKCSRFEVAWSDGSYWVRDVDLDNDGLFDVRAGDLVWFDPTRRRPNDEENDENAERMTYQEIWERYGDRNQDGSIDDDSSIRWAVVYTDPDINRLDQIDGPLGGEEGEPIELSPEVGFGDASFFNTDSTFDRAGSSPVGRRLWVKTGGDFTEDLASATQSNAPYYNPDLTGGVPSPAGWPDLTPTSPTDDLREYLAVWPFRIPGSDGSWGGAYEKNVWVRVRFTLHDPQGRVTDGRTYEVVLHMHPRDARG